MDYDLAGCCELPRKIDIPILPSGSWIQDLPAFQNALDANSWSAARKYLSEVESARMQCEIIAWGNTLVSSANLHLMLGTGLSTCFEQAVPWEPYEYGMHDVIRTQRHGHVVAPSGPGLGVEIAWDAMKSTTIHRLETHSPSPSP